MEKSICGICCDKCPYQENCKGCTETGGCPFGKQCFVAKYILTGGMEQYVAFQEKLMEEINALQIPGMEKVTALFPLVGRYVNMAYPLPNGGTVQFLQDDEMYLGAQVKNLFDDSGKTCYGVVARENFILVCTYGENGVDPEIVVYRRR